MSKHVILYIVLLSNLDSNLYTPVPPRFRSASRCALLEKVRFLENLQELQKDKNMRTLERIKSVIFNNVHFVLSGIKFF